MGSETFESLAVAFDLFATLGLAVRIGLSVFLWNTWILSCFPGVPPCCFGFGPAITAFPVLDIVCLFDGQLY